MHTYVLLLRGINVGGNNIMPMKDLRACLADIGCTDVQTYIQSGNVVFKSRSTKVDYVTKKIAAALKKTFSYTNPILVIPAAVYRTIVASAPSNVGANADQYRYDTIFVMPPLRAPEAAQAVAVRDGIDQMSVGEGALFFTRTKGQESKSYLSKIVKSKIYQQVTIRNWNTTIQLLNMIS